MKQNKIRKLILKIRDSRLVQPIFYSKFIDYHQWSLLSFVSSEASKIKPNKSVLDAGAGELKYKKYFNHCKYVSQDLCIGDEQWYFNDIDIKSSIYDIPVKIAALITFYVLK